MPALHKELCMREQVIAAAMVRIEVTADYRINVRGAKTNGAQSSQHVVLRRNAKPVNGAGWTGRAGRESGIDQNPMAVRALDEISGYGHFGQRMNSVLENEQFHRPGPRAAARRRNTSLEFAETSQHSAPLGIQSCPILLPRAAGVTRQPGITARLP